MVHIIIPLYSPSILALALVRGGGEGGGGLYAIIFQCPWICSTCLMYFPFMTYHRVCVTAHPSGEHEFTAGF